MTTRYLKTLDKRKEEGSRYQVQLKLGTRHKKDSLHKEGRDRAEIPGCSAQSEFEVKQKVQPCSDSRLVTGECWGHVGPWLWKEAKIKEEERTVNWAEGTLTENGSKWSKKQKRRSELRESYLLKEQIKEDRSAKKMDCGQLSKQKNPSMSALEHHAKNKER
jgi:hypothetical protein